MTRMILKEDRVTEFLCLADRFDALAAEARTTHAKQGLERLATRFRVFAARYATRGTSDQPSTALEEPRLK
jgi:hypothetical protein